MTTYHWNQITPQFITELYLSQNPTGLLQRFDDDLNPILSNGQPVYYRELLVDAVTFMSEGPGRYVDPSQFTGIQKLFTQSLNLQHGLYSIEDLINTGHFNANDFKLYTLGLLIDPDHSDYGARTYISNSQSYTLSSDLTVTVDTYGIHISDMQILPFDDNFDFDSSNPFTEIGNSILEDMVDPGRAGHTVDFIFENKGAVALQTGYETGNITYDSYDYAIDNAKVKYPNSVLALNGFEKAELFEHLYSEIKEVIKTLEATGSILHPKVSIDEYSVLIDTLIGQATAQLSPLVFDLDGDGIETTSLAGNNTVYFDHNHNGFAELSGWVTGGDGLLAVDLNEDGLINSGSELFGDQTSALNGFDVLKQYDSNGDKKITAEDAVWSDLKIWIDANEDGYSQANELNSLDALNITQIDLSYADVNTSTNGNTIKETGSFTINGNTRTVGDVYFAVDEMNTRYNSEYELDGNALLVPTLRGYGTLPDLYIAMSLDNDGTGNLLELVEDFNAQDFATLFSSTTDVSDDVRAILYRWADIESVSPTGRGSYVDGQELAFLEKLTGQPFLQRGAYSDPRTYAGDDLTRAFDIALNKYTALLMAQGAGKELFEGDVGYNGATDSFEGITGLDLTKLGLLETEATGLANTGAREVFWQNVVRMIEYTVGVDNLDSGDENALADAIHDSDASLNLGDIVDSLIETPVIIDVTGTSGADTLSGFSGNDELNGLAGNDILNGNGGNDTLNGGNGNDTLTGGTGGDLLQGGADNDTYVYNVGDGDDVIVDLSGSTDKIQFGAGITISDLSFARMLNDDMVITINTGSSTGEIIVQNQFGSGTIESILFNDTSTFNLTAQHWTLNGTSGNDLLYGVFYGGGANDTIYGDDGHDRIFTEGGNDIIYGDAGNDYIEAGADDDTVYGGDGNDTIYGEGGNDILYGGAGDDIVNGSSGNDIYYFTSGHDIYYESGSGTDAIYLPTGFTSGATVYYKIGYDLKIVLDANNSILIDEQFTAGKNIETLYFYGGTSVTLSGVSYVLQGDETNNNLTGSANADTLYGMGGNDTMDGNGGADYLDGGDGNDTIYGDTGNDTLIGGLGNDTLRGEADNDIMEGGAGDDTILGGAGNDTYIYTSGHDIFTEASSGTDVIKLIAGWDISDLTFMRYDANPSDLVIKFGSGATNSITLNDHFSNVASAFETLEFSDLSTIDLKTRQYETYGTNSGEILNGIVYNGSVDDIFYALGGDDTVWGANGNDIIYGGDGNDILRGEAGNDILYGEEGDDTLEGKDGDDIYVYSGGMDTFYENNSSGSDTVRITGVTTINDISITQSGSHATMVINSGVDEILLNWMHYNTNYNIEKIEFEDGFSTTLMDYSSWTSGTSGNDTITGTGSHNTIIGKAGNDTLDGAGGDDNVHGGAGNDIVKGGSGVDIVHGGVGDDTIYGGDGLDTLYGGSGEDIFVFEAASAFNNIDVIKDFKYSEDDKIDISDLLVGYTSGVSDINDFVSLTESSGNTTLVIDRDGTAGTYNDASIATLTNVSGLIVDHLLANGNLIV
jgi:Ca2+-binding RTX toxin-like protein